ncbi:MAG: flavodoxin family protein [Lentisphaeria bacterium]|jgi:multimeric flavodoxin WrbA|nr:flavodoxin family protein [Lentisphaeria bacterium]
MNVLLINGSPRRNGCTSAALQTVADQLQQEGVDTHLLHISDKPIQACTACGACRKTGNGCIFTGDLVNEAAERLCRADGLIVGSPVYFAGPNGSLCAFLDRMFFSRYYAFAFKPAAAVVNCRRGGASAAFDRLNKYFTMSNMPVVSSQYWNSMHGLTPEEGKADLEGQQTLRTLARNMAWLLKCIDNAKGKVPRPILEQRTQTNFIR